jgi:hypothetical protein
VATGISLKSPKQAENFGDQIVLMNPAASLEPPQPPSNAHSGDEFQKNLVTPLMPVFLPG